MIEHIIAYHCGPALAGIKPANLVACQKSQIPNVRDEMDRLNKELNCKDIYLEVLYECDKRVLVMVYRSKVMQKYLQDSEISFFLQTYGYPKAVCCKVLLAFLRERLKENSFPHEIGAFLGYPIHDIYGFMNHKNEGCLMTGEWKVYQDEEAAKKLFCRYHKCRKAIMKHMMMGKTLAQLFCAV